VESVKVGEGHAAHERIQRLAPGEEGKFVGRAVRLGDLMGDSYVVLNGVQAGDAVVTEGSFFLRAEMLKNP
jgi:hypothetical protein